MFNSLGDDSVEYYPGMRSRPGMDRMSMELQEFSLFMNLPCSHDWAKVLYLHHVYLKANYNHSFKINPLGDVLTCWNCKHLKARNRYSDSCHRCNFAIVIKGIIL